MTLKKCKRPYQELLQRHTDDHQQLFNRLQLSLGTENLQKEALPTNERLKSFEQDPTDNGLTELYYQYGRYLLIASSRPGGLPANLQGIWNRHVQPPWGSNYTTNINTEMNYWPAEITNLPECFLPLSDFIAAWLSMAHKRPKLTMASIADGWPTITRTSGHKPLRPEAMIPIRKAHLDGRAGQWQAYGSVSIYGNTMPSAAIKILVQNGLSPDERRSRIPAAMAAKRSGNRLLDYQPIHFTRESLPLYRQGRKETERRDQPFIRYGSRSGMGLTDQLHRSKYGAGYGQSISPAVHGCTSPTCNRSASVQKDNYSNGIKSLKRQTLTIAMYPICSPCTPDDRLSPNSSRNAAACHQDHSKSAETAAQAGLWHGKLTSGHVCATVIMLSGC